MASISSSTISSWVVIYDGELAYRNTIVFGGALVSSGGTANENTVNSGGYLYVYSGGTARQIKENGGYVYVADGADVTFVTNAFSGLVLSSYDRATVHSGTTANSTTVNANGRLVVSSGGTANATTVNSGGDLHVSSGGTATNIVAFDGGRLDIDVAPNTYIQGTSDGSSFLMENAFIAGYTVNLGGVLSISSGGTANETTVSSGGYLYVYGGGTANETTVSSNGSMCVFSGGTATNIVAFDGGRLDIDVAPNTYIQGTSDGSSFLMENAFIAGYTVNLGGVLSISSGGTANSTTVNSGGALVVSSGGTANSTTVNSGGALVVSSGGTANSTTVNSSGWLWVSSGGTANETTVNSSGWLWVSSGGTANETTVNGGGMEINSGGTANSITVNDYGVLYVMNDSLLNAATINSFMTYVEGGTITKSIVNSDGGLHIRGGTLNETIVNDGGYLSIASGCIATGIVLSSGGVLGIAVAPNTYIQGTSANSSFLMENAFISHYTVNSYGHLGVFSGGTAEDIAVNEWGYLAVASGGTALQIKENGGYVDFQNGAKVTFVSNSFSGVVLLEGWRNIATVHSGTTANETTVNPFCQLSVYSGGTANSTMLNSGGSLIVASGGLIRGLQIEEGAVISAYAGAEINFDLTGRTSSDDVLITRQNLIQGLPSYTITVSAAQETGLYRLASGVDSFASSITITSASGASDTLTVGNSVQLDDLIYSLDLAKSYLTLSVAPPDITPPDAPTASADITTATNQNVTVTAVFSNDSVRKQYSLNNQTWDPYTDPIVMTENGIVYFRGFDEAGNVSEITSYTVENIQEITPDPVTPDPVTPEPSKPEPQNPSLPDAPEGLSASVKKYNAALVWNKAAAEKGVKVSYEVWMDGNTDASKSNKYTLKNADVGTHSFAVRAVFSDGRVSNWSDTVKAEVYDITPPKAGALTVTQTDADSVRLDWAPAADNVGIDHYVVTCGEDVKTVSGSVLSAEFKGVAGKVNAILTAFDTAGNASKTVKKSLKIADVSAPTQVTGLHSEGVNNKSGGVLAWNPAIDNVGVTQYLIAVEGQKTYKSKTNSVKVKKMPAGSYKFTVTALDKAKNQSIVSKEGSFTVADVIAPKVKKVAAKVYDNSAVVTWKATDETGIAKLDLSVDGGKAVNVTNLGSYDLADLSAGVHSLRLSAYDAAGNMAVKEAAFKVKEPKNAGVLAAV